MTDSAAYRDHLRDVLDRNGMDTVDVVLPEQSEIQVGTLRLHYHDWGNDGAIPLLFLHGGGLTSHTWDVACLALRDSYHCFAVDLRGHGDSQWAETYQIDSHAGDVRAVANVLGLRDLVLIGMSLGGLVALRYAELNRDLRALVIVDIGPDAQRSEGSRRIQDFIDTAELDAVEDFVELSLKFNPRRNRKMLHASLMHNLRQLPNGKWTWKYDRRQFTRSAQLDRLMGDLKAIWEKVSEIGCPTLIVRGSDSDVLSAQAAKHLAEQFPDGTYAEVPRAGHTVQGDNPAAFVAELRRFLRMLGN